MPAGRQKPKKYVRSAYFSPERSERRSFILHRYSLYIMGIALVCIWVFVIFYIFFFPQMRTVFHATAIGFSQKIGAPGEAAIPTAIFSDVSSTHKYAQALQYFKDRHVLAGYKDGSFQPDAPLQRAEFIKFLVTALNLYPTPVMYTQCFTDVKSEWFAPQVCYAKAKGWIKGYPDKSFHPRDEVKKNEIIKILLLAFKVELQEGLLPDDSQNQTSPSVSRAEASELIYRGIKTYSNTVSL